MIRMLVGYGAPEDPAAFERHYHEVHVPLAWTLPGLREYRVSRGEISSPTGDAPYLVASLAWDSAAELEAALGSPEGAQVSADVEKFASGGWWLWTFEEAETEASAPEDAGVRA
jgi:uncharacterized protein (TIGR02118 family)